MPIYVYKFVDTGETIEVEQAFTDETLTEYPHPDSGKPMAVKKVFQPVGVTFKGSGFYKTDSRAGSKSKATPASKSTTSDATTDGASSSDSSSTGTSSNDTAASSTATTTSD